MTRSLFRYYGGKWRVAPWIVSHFPEHRIYIEPFGGAGSVLFRKPKSYAELFNDLNHEIVNLFRILQDDVKKKNLQEKLSLTPFARMEYDNAFIPSDDEIENARRFLIRAGMGYHADSVIAKNYKSGFRTDFRRKHSLPAHNWASYPGYIDIFADRLAGVIIENMDAFALIEKHKDDSNILWYLDPPYPHDTRTQANKHKYAYELTDEQHRLLIDLLQQIRGMVIISSYDNPIYTELEKSGWKKESRTYRNNTYQSGARTECIWINQECLKEGI
ncbi:MAG: hypothetical protein A2020_12275 [Lentisphaerae bacterium GWF2_45_14]|nr:MAG: hypothetical protein A2020_12275 [Lentisphaerae bacterium GWF2_45_14]